MRFLQYMEVIRLINAVSDKHPRVFLSWRTYDAVDHSLRQVTDGLEIENLTMNEWRTIQRLQTAQSC